MSEPKDPAIKLFGKTIPLPETSAAFDTDSPGGLLSATSTATASCGEKSIIERDDADTEISADQDQGEISQKVTEAEQEDEDLPLISEESVNPDAISGTNENPGHSSVESQTAILSSEKNEEEKSETGASQEKSLKKPDKILPCPRCNSMDTKFCYYNNYNVNQPRHFCKNCQRYWTAGGTMRNVPVGAGRRKSKNSASHYRHITVTEALQNGRAEAPNGFHHPSMKANGTVLTFGTDAPLCESIASVLNLSEKKMQNGTRNGFQRPEELKIPVPCGDGETWDDKLNGSSVKAVNSEDEEGKGRAQTPVMQNCQAFPPQMPCFPGAPWLCQWNSAQWSPPLPPPTFCPPAFPMPFYPAPAYWGCTVPGTWNIPWVPQPPSPPNPMAQNCGPISPLGKHSRDENMVEATNSEKEQIKENESEKCLWIPKTLRIDDPEEAAKSSIWATLGIKNDKGDPVSGGGLFKAFNSKADEKSQVSESSPVLHANPAALSRSLDFHERS